MAIRIPVALVALGLSIGHAIDPPSLAQMLARVGDSVRQFEDDFAIVISDEAYEQTDVVRSDGAGPRSSTTRHLRSEMFFVWLPEQQSWLTARHVLLMDGAPVADSTDRLEAALREPGATGRARLRQLRDEGARFNLGRVDRNFNDPTLVLQFLDPRYQPHFTFSLLGRETLGHVDTWKIAFAEHTSPTLIQTPAGDLPSNGVVWVGRADNAVVRTSLMLTEGRTDSRATIVVDYHRSPKLGVVMPTRMVERYEQHMFVNGASPGAPRRIVATREWVDCVATYANFRRFETSGRLVTPP